MTPDRLAEIVKAADEPKLDNPDYERMRGFVGELLDALAMQKEQQSFHQKRYSRELAILHNGRRR